MKNKKLKLLLLVLVLFLHLFFVRYDNSFAIYKQTLTAPISLSVISPSTAMRLTFHSDGGTTFDQQTVIYGGTAELPTPTKTNYNFVGWYTDNENWTTQVNETTPITSDMDLYAKYVKIVCKKASGATLHSETCDQTANSGCHRANTFATGAPITYGSTPGATTYNAGDAYDCDVNDDGTYSPTDERFYLLRKNTTDDTMVLIFYTSIDAEGYIETNGANARAGAIYTYSDAPTYLPTANDSTIHDAWDNPNLVAFNGKVARFPTVNDLNIACEIADVTVADTYLDNCHFMLENSRYQSTSKGRAGIWLEKVGNINYRIHTNTVSVSTGNENAVRPVIEIPVSLIDGASFAPQYNVTFNTMGGPAVSGGGRYEGQALGNLITTPVREGFLFIGWYTDTEWETEVTTETLMPAHDVVYYARWQAVSDNLEYVFRIEGSCEFHGAPTQQNANYVTSSNNNCISVNKAGTTINYTASGNEVNYIDSGVALFSQANIDKDFEVGFTVAHINGNILDIGLQATLVNSKLENSSMYYPGFVMRHSNTSGYYDKLELTEKFNNVQALEYFTPVDGTQFRIIRRNGKIYYAVDDDEPTEFQDITGYDVWFNLNTWFGATSNKSDRTSNGVGSTAKRYLDNVTLSNIYIKLQRDPSHEVTFITEAGTLDMPSTRTVEEGNPIGELPTVTRDHYTFNGWYVENSDGTLIDATYEVDDDVNLIASFTPVNYTITLNTNGGTSVGNITQAYGTYVLSLPSSSLKTHYTFDDWYTDYGTFLDTVVLPFQITGDDTFYANWIPDEHTITFVPNNGTTIPQLTVDYGTAPGANFPSNPTKTDYIFAGWYSDPGFNNPVNANTIVTGNITYYARWVQAGTFQIIYNTQGGDSISPDTRNAGDQIGTLATPTKTYFDFAGWYLDVDLTVPVDTTALVTSDVTVYAKWTLKSIYVAQIGDTYHETLAGAIDSIETSNQTTVIILKDITLTETVTIPSGRDIVIQGNGNTVTSSTIQLLDNNGTLEIASGTFTSTAAEADVLTNLAGGILTVSGGNISSTNSNCIDNSGTLYVTGGNIAVTASNQGTINNNANAVIYVSGGYIDNSSTRQAIYNAGDVYVSGGTLTSNATQRATIHNYANNAHVTVSGGVVESRNKNCNTGAIISDASKTGTSITVTGGTVISRSTNTTTGVAAIKVSSGTLTIGVNESGVYDATSPVIQGERNGIYSTVNFSIYDGIIKGKELAAVDNRASRVPAANTEICTEPVEEVVDGYNVLYYELIGGYHVTFDANGGTATRYSKIVVENTAVGELPDASYTGYIFDGWYTSGGQLVTEETLVTEDNTTYTARWVNSVLQANIANTTVTMNVNGTSTINVSNAASLESYTYSSNDKSIATVNSSGVITATGPGITQIVLTGDRSGDKKQIIVTSNLANDIQTFDIMPGAMRTYFNNIDMWAKDQTDASHSSYDLYMSNNLSTYNCVNFNGDDRANKSTSTGTVYCDQPNEYDTGVTGNVLVYEYDPDTSSTIKQATYVTANNGKLYNFIPGVTYYWESASDSSQNGKLYAFGERRIIKIDNLKNGSSDTYFQTRNVRDLGGIEVTYDIGDTTVTGKIKYNKLYRGEKIWGGAGDSLQYFTKLGIDHEMDLRGNSEPVTAEEDSFAASNKIRSASQTYEIIHYGIDYISNNTNYTLARNALIEVMNAFIDANDPESANYNPDYSLYFHCRIGADRTGTLAYLLEGLLGVSEEDRYRDYEMTVFFGLDERTRFYYNKGSNTTKFQYMKQAIKNASADGQTEDVVAWFLQGSSNTSADMALINAFREVMIEKETEVATPICKPVTNIADLHTETCGYDSGEAYCYADGYYAEGSKGTTTITYGKIWDGTSALQAGDAFDCDLNGNGVYDERFYYVSDYFNTQTKTFDTDTGVLIYYKNYYNGAPTVGYAAPYETMEAALIREYNVTNHDNWHGPLSIVNHLPLVGSETNQWRNGLLKVTDTANGTRYRSILAEYQSTHNAASTIGGTLPTAFEYANSSGAANAARLLTAQEVMHGCGLTEAMNIVDWELSGCNFLFEGTTYSTSSGRVKHIWLETPRASSGTRVLNLSSSNLVINGATAPTNYGVRPVIDVPKYQLLVGLNKPSVVSVTLNNQSATTAGTGTIYEKFETGWYSNSAATTSISSITIPTKTGLTFGGYFTGMNGTGTQIIDQLGNIIGSNTSLFDDATIYAHWTNIATITLNNQSATTAGTATLYELEGVSWYSDSAATTEITSITLPTKTGLIFGGYYTATNGSGTLVIDKSGSIVGNSNLFSSDTTIYAYWFDSNIVCKPVTSASSLHKENCEYSSGDGYCYADGYYTEGSKGTNRITYGSIWDGTSALQAGDAFDCDLNGNGVYDERFYYVSDYYDTQMQTFDTDTGVLIYYRNYVNGIPSDNGVQYSTIQDIRSTGASVVGVSNIYGPLTAVNNLPITGNSGTWQNDLVKITDTANETKYRTLLAENLDTHNATSTTGGALSTFEYKKANGVYNAARLLTAQEVMRGCGLTGAGRGTIGELSNCNFLFERTKYVKSDYAVYGIWIETPVATSSTSIFVISGADRKFNNHNVDSDGFGVRPAIDVPKYRLGIGVSKPDVVTVTLNNRSATTAGTETIYEKFDNGWYSNSTATTSISSIIPPTKTGFGFGGYFTGINGVGNKVISQTGSIIGSNKSLMSDSTLYAYWANILTITLDNQSATTAGTATIYELQNVDWYSNSAATTLMTSITVPTKTGSTFGGYYTEANGKGTMVINKSGDIVASSSLLTSNTTIYAYWFNQDVVCKAVTSQSKLHTETCNYTSGTDYCYGDGYYDEGSKGTNIITYGSIWDGTSALKTGDAFDCDVSGNGIYDKRFYYVSDYFNTQTKTFDTDTGVLIYSHNFQNGVPFDFGVEYDSSRENWHGPVTLLEHLPLVGNGTNQWRSDLLKITDTTNNTKSRAILAESYTEHNLTSTTNGIALPTAFEYKNSSNVANAARLITAQEIMRGCGLTQMGGNPTGTFSSCNFLFEATKYSDSHYTSSGIWSETPIRDRDSNSAWAISARYRYTLNPGTWNTNYGARPVIDVPKTKLIYEPEVMTVTLDNQSATTAGTATIYENYDKGWYSDSTITTTISSITVPTKSGLTFGGYYTGTNGNGTIVINQSGNIVGSDTLFVSDSTLYAYWFDSSVICKAVTNVANLHTETCVNTSNRCYNDGYYAEGSKGTNIITYGSIWDGTSALQAGDAFDCDVNGDGVYNERFYYMTDYYNTQSKTFDTNTGVLIHSGANTSAYATLTDINDAGYSVSEADNWHGPLTAVNVLPLVGNGANQWRSNLLKITDTINNTKYRAIISENGSAAVTSGGTLPTEFEYKNSSGVANAARLLTAQEVMRGCGLSQMGSQTDGELSGCNFLLERTGYSGQSSGFGVWLETPYKFSRSSAWYLGGSEVRTYYTTITTTSGIVKSVIDVPKTGLLH